MSSETLHEDPKTLGAQVINRHRAVVSLMEELEAIDWYDQRLAATDDEELKAVLSHTRDEEKEHAAMILEWLRRRDPALDRNLRKFLFTEEPLSALIAKEDAEPPAPVEPPVEPTGEPGQHLGIGDLRGANTNEPAAEPGDIRKGMR
jgi:ferritin-like protein